MRTTRTPAPRGYTLVEFLVASVVIALVLVSLISVYIHGYAMLRRGAVQTWAQHRAHAALTLIGEEVRPAYTFDVFSAYSANPGNEVITGNYLKVVDLYSATSAFYRSGSTLYYVESEATDNKATSTDDVALVTDLMPVPASAFIGLYNRVQVVFRVCDPRETNRVLVAIDSYVTPRNE